MLRMLRIRFPLFADVVALLKLLVMINIPKLKYCLASQGHPWIPSLKVLQIVFANYRYGQSILVVILRLKISTKYFELRRHIDYLLHKR